MNNRRFRMFEIEILSGTFRQSGAKKLFLAKASGKPGTLAVNYDFQTGKYVFKRVVKARTKSEAKSKAIKSLIDTGYKYYVIKCIDRFRKVRDIRRGQFKDPVIPDSQIPGPGPKPNDDNQIPHPNGNDKILLEKGDRGEDVRRLHLSLIYLGFNIDRRELQTHLFGNSTEVAVKNIQKKARLAQTGKFDKKTRDAIAKILKSTTFEIKGTLITANPASIKNATVHLWAKHQGKDIDLKKQVKPTEGNGFNISVSVTDIIRYEHKLKLFVKVMKDNEIIYSSDGKVHWTLRNWKETLDVTLPVIEDNDNSIPSKILIKGVLEDHVGKSVSGANVTLYRLSDGKSKYLNKNTHSDDSGEFSFKLNVSDLEQRESKLPIPDVGIGDNFGDINTPHDLEEVISKTKLFIKVILDGKNVLDSRSSVVWDMNNWDMIRKFVLPNPEEEEVLYPKFTLEDYLFIVQNSHRSPNELKSSSVYKKLVQYADSMNEKKLRDFFAARLGRFSDELSNAIKLKVTNLDEEQDYNTALLESIEDYYKGIGAKKRSVPVNSFPEQIMAGAQNVGTQNSIAPKDLLGNVRFGRGITSKYHNIIKGFQGEVFLNDTQAIDRIEIKTKVNTWINEGLIANPLMPDLPIISNPNFRTLFNLAKLHYLCDIAGLKDKKRENICDKCTAIGTSIENLTDKVLATLVDLSEITEGDIKNLALALNLFEFCDQSFEIARNVLNSDKIKAFIDIIDLDDQNWLNCLSGAVLPFVQIDTKAYAEMLVKKAEILFAGTIILKRIARFDTDLLKSSLELIETIKAANKDINGDSGEVVRCRDFYLLNGIYDNDIDTKDLYKAHSALRGMAAKYPGFDLLRVFDEEDYTEIKRVLENDIKSNFEKFRNNNKEKNYLVIDFSTNSDSGAYGLNFNNIDKDEEIVECLKAYQRIYSITKNIDHTIAILSAGYTSAAEIVDLRLEEFIERTKLGKKDSKKYFSSAKQAVSAASSALANTLDLRNGGFSFLDANNIEPGTEERFAEIPGYEETFGKVTSSKCEHWRSILGPSAYFVDLMDFVEKNITRKYFAYKPDHWLNLNCRRPDLRSKITFTEKNTFELVPYLQIIIEILESHLGSDHIYRDLIYKCGDRGFCDIHSIKQPYLVPMSIADKLLEFYNVERADISEKLNCDKKTKTMSSLQLSSRESELIKNSDCTQKYLDGIYNITFKMASSNDGKMKWIDVTWLMSYFELEREELGNLFNSDFVKNAGEVNIGYVGIEGVEDILTDSLRQSGFQEIEFVKELNHNVLDRAHRFVRLQKKTPFSINELDEIVRNYSSKTGGKLEINDGLLDFIALLIRIQKKLNIPSEEISGIIGFLHKDERSLKDPFVRIFNKENFVKVSGEWPTSEASYIHPAHTSAADLSATDFTHQRLLSSLRISSDELRVLIENLGSLIGFCSTGSSDDDKKISLSIENLSALYIHSYISRSLHLSVFDLFDALALIKRDKHIIESLDDISELIKLIGWIKQFKLSLKSLKKVVNDTDILDNLEKEVKEKLLAPIVYEEKLLFDSTYLSTIGNISKEQCKTILEGFVSHNILGEKDEDDGSKTIKKYYLNVDYYTKDVATILKSISTDVSFSVIDQLLLNKSHEMHTLSFIEELTGTSSEKIEEIINFADLDFKTESILNTINNGGDYTELLKCIRAIIKLDEVEKMFSDGFDKISILKNICSFRDLFSLTDFNDINLTTLEQISWFADFARNEKDNETGTVFMLEYLRAFSKVRNLREIDPRLINEILKTEKINLNPYFDHLSKRGLLQNCMESLWQLKEVSGFVNMIGLDLTILTSLLSDGKDKDSYNQISNAAEALWAVLLTRFPNKKDYEKYVEPFNEKVLECKRDALVNHIRENNSEFEDTIDLYKYFLIDVEMEGSVKISRLVAAISSLQLYVQRCLFNLEQSDGKDSIHILPEDIPIEEWEWRKNYRVWEANRKIFLFPENYLEPDLRDNKSPQFKTLEENLLQRDINEESCMDSYAQYLKEFDEISNLKIAGAYLDTNSESSSDVLHLFGVKTGEPLTYYYRTVENLHSSNTEEGKGIVWNPWEKINVQIPVDKVSPIIYNGKLYLFWISFVTTPKNVFQDGKSIFTGYEHKMSIQFSSMKLNGEWSNPQSLKVKGAPILESTEGIISDPKVEEGELATFAEAAIDLFNPFKATECHAEFRDAFADLMTPKYDTKQHNKEVEGYTLKGFLWDRVYPEVVDGKLLINCAGFMVRGVVDLYKLEVRSDSNYRGAIATNGRYEEYKNLLRISDNKLVVDESHRYVNAIDKNAMKGLLTSDDGSDPILQKLVASDYIDKIFHNDNSQILIEDLQGVEILTVNGESEDAIVSVDGHTFLLKSLPESKWQLIRISSTLGESLNTILFTTGLDSLLDIKTQIKLEESEINSAALSKSITTLNKSELDFNGAFGTYYWEIFYHIPSMIAHHLNSGQKFEESQKWYHYIFNPTAVVDLSEFLNEDKARVDKNWQFIRLRDVNFDNLLEQMGDQQAVEEYLKNPFNPHAIARLRISAYQKNVIMKYLDNLIDWGDSLFRQDTTESINEASLIYAIADEILGKKPLMVGEKKFDEKNYINVYKKRWDAYKTMIEMEHVSRAQHFSTFSIDRFGDFLFDRQAVLRVNKRVRSQFPITSDTRSKMVEMKALLKTRIAKSGLSLAPSNPSKLILAGSYKGAGWKKALYRINTTEAASINSEISRQLAAGFAMPINKDLFKYWDRVFDRQFKIRNSMDINGNKRQLALFAPELDPLQIARANQKGISVSDLLKSVSVSPHFRFSYLIEKAKAAAAHVQGVGGALLSALEKKDAEELNLLRAVHEKNIMEMVTKTKELELKAEGKNLEASALRQESIKYRINYFEELISERVNKWEQTQSDATLLSSTYKIYGSSVFMAGSMLSLIPNTGSPFAMTWGGRELGKSTSDFGMYLSNVADIADNVARLAELEGRFNRRVTEWQHQKKLAEDELRQAEKQHETSLIRYEILKKGLKQHLKSLDHSDEIYQFYGSKFTNLGLYKWYAKRLQFLYRESFNSAYKMAKWAEQAYHFENNNKFTFINSSYFNDKYNGLLSGELLMNDLQKMELNYLEVSKRKIEISQTFSLLQLDPMQLMELKENGECYIVIPELFFDLVYPGHYRRIIKNVSLSIPAIAGPNVNVNATLSLEEHCVRSEANTETEILPNSHTRNEIIATSSAQNDSGMFNINFNDECFLPFEGFGAISKWKLSLPTTFRQFNYSTINDVLLHINYTSEYDCSFKHQVEGIVGSATNDLISRVKSNDAPLYRLFSFKYDFPEVYNKLCNSPTNTEHHLEFLSEHFPFLFNGNDLAFSSFELICKMDSKLDLDGFKMNFNGVDLNGTTGSKSIVTNGLNGKNVRGEKILSISNLGNLHKDSDEAGIDPDKVDDIMMLVKYVII